MQKTRMFLRSNCFLLLLLINVVQSKPILIARNVSDCSITTDGILLYHGKHSLTRFHHECLPWHELQTVYSELITEPNFFMDASIYDAKNYCRNPNLTRQGPWCFVEDGDEIRMEECGVCQSLKPQTTSPSEDAEDEKESVTVPPINRNLFEQLRAEIRRMAALFREKFREIIERIQKQSKKLVSRFNERFNLNWK